MVLDQSEKRSLTKYHGKLEHSLIEEWLARRRKLWQDAASHKRHDAAIPAYPLQKIGGKSWQRTARPSWSTILAATRQMATAA
jgi:hypothetical protein